MQTQIPKEEIIDDMQGKELLQIGIPLRGKYESVELENLSTRTMK